MGGDSEAALLSHLPFTTFSCSPVSAGKASTMQKLEKNKKNTEVGPGGDLRMLELQFWEHWNPMDVGGLSESQHSSHLCLSAHSHPLLRCLVMEEGPARGAWSSSKREIYVLHIHFWEWEMSNSQTSARAGDEHQGEKAPGEQGPGSPQGPEEPETRRWHLTTSLS